MKRPIMPAGQHVITGRLNLPINLNSNTGGGGGEPGSQTFDIKVNEVVHRNAPKSYSENQIFHAQFQLISMIWELNFR